MKVEMNVGATTLVCIGLGLTSPALAQDWTPVDIGRTDAIRQFNNGGFGDRWLVGDGGLMASSTDFVNWTIVDAETTEDLPSMVRWNSQTLFAGSSAGVVVLSHNLGATWVQRPLPVTDQIFKLYSRSGGQANAAGDGGDIYQTLNQGLDWVRVYEGDVPLHSGAGFISSLSWVCGDDGLVLMTSDAGENWIEQPTGSSDDLHVLIQAMGWLFAGGTNGTIVRSKDSGATWERLPTGTAETIRDIAGTSSNTLYAVGDNGTLIRGTEGGDEWCTIDPQTTENLLAITTQIAQRFLIAGENGFMSFTETGGGDCTDVVPVLPGGPLDGPLPLALILTAPRPNPFESSTSFAFAIPDALNGATVRIELFDASGARVRLLVDEPIAGGAHVVRWDGFDDAGTPVATGTYFARLRAGRSVAHEKVTVVR